MSMEKIKCKLCDKEVTSFRLVNHIKFNHDEYTTEKYVQEFGEFRPKQIKQNLKESQENIFECKICGSKETVGSFRAHLKWNHSSYNTEKYVQEFGEFRPKQIKQNLKKNNSKLECKICDKKMMHNRQLMYHLTKFHPEINKSDYIIEHMYNNISPLCKCGCGEKVTILENGKNCDLGKETYHRDYVKGHIDWEVFSNIGKQSKEEIELVEFIKSIYSNEIKTNIRGIIPKAELDIYLPDLLIAIEYNGLYWHSEKGGRDKNYHIDKLKKCQEANIRLIQIFSDEWLNKKNIVKNKLISIITKNKTNKIYARKCQIKEISSKDKNKFLNENHIQGACRSQIKLGIFYSNELVGVATFSKPRIALGGDKKIDNYELVRYASSKHIIGGLNKILKYFAKNYNPKEIYSYSDNRWSDPNNNMYIKSGFKKISQSFPNYFYTKDYLTRIHRYNFNKFKLKKMGMDIKNYTEFQLMEKLGYTKIWDCGSTKFSIIL